MESAEVKTRRRLGEALSVWDGLMKKDQGRN